MACGDLNSHVKPEGGVRENKLRILRLEELVDHTFNAGAKIDPVNGDAEYQYLYNDDMGYHFNCPTYEQISWKAFD